MEQYISWALCYEPNNILYIFITRPFTTPRVLGGSPQESTDSEESENEEDTETVENTAAKKHVPENGAQIRDKSSKRDEFPNKGSAKHWQATPKQMGSQQRNKSGHGGQQGKWGGGKDDHHNREYKGSRPRHSNPQGDKGGGKDDAKLQRERTYKEKNKARKANHNRKAGADRKRRGGMGALPPGM